MSSGSETRMRAKRRPPLRGTAAEFAEIDAAAADAEKTVCSYMRDVLFREPHPGPRRLRRRPLADVVELARISGLLGKYGSNVNQLAHVANSDGDRITEGELREIAAQVRELQLEVRKAIGGGH